MRRIGSTVFSFLLLSGSGWGGEFLGAGCDGGPRDGGDSDSCAACRPIFRHGCRGDGLWASDAAVCAVCSGGRAASRCGRRRRRSRWTRKGATSRFLARRFPSGIPQSVFSSGEAKWLGVTMGEEAELARTVLVATPYSIEGQRCGDCRRPCAWGFSAGSEGRERQTGDGNSGDADQHQPGDSGRRHGADDQPDAGRDLLPGAGGGVRDQGLGQHLYSDEHVQCSVVFPTSQTFPGTASLTAANVYKVSQFLGATGTATKTADSSQVR